MPHQECPKCQYQRQPSDAHVLAGTCPSCGVAYEKWLARKDHSPSLHTKEPAFTIQHHQPLLQKISNVLCYTPDRVDPLTFWWRIFLLVGFFIWAWSFILGGMSWESIGGSFLHNIILPFHEFGHVLFSPFGNFMMILGGSLFQVTMPLGIMCVFIFQQRDTFAATIMLWWCGQSFVDLSPYIADAEYRALPLIMGMGEESHDWGNLLSMTNSIEHAITYGRLSFGIGSVIMMISFCWGAYLLVKQKRVLSDR